MNRRNRSKGYLVAAAVPLIALSGCGADEVDRPSGALSASRNASSGASAQSGSTAQADFPDVLKAELKNEGGTYSLQVTMSSEYDTPQRYADGWRVTDPQGNELGTMKLGHDHASEQPFTRSQTGLKIPGGVEKVTIEGHDLQNGYGGATLEIDVPA